MLTVEEFMAIPDRTGYGVLDPINLSTWAANAAGHHLAQSWCDALNNPDDPSELSELLEDVDDTIQYLRKWVDEIRSQMLHESELRIRLHNAVVQYKLFSTAIRKVQHLPEMGQEPITAIIAEYARENFAEEATTLLLKRLGKIDE